MTLPNKFKMHKACRHLILLRALRRDQGLKQKGTDTGFFLREWRPISGRGDKVSVKTLFDGGLCTIDGIPVCILKY